MRRLNLVIGVFLAAILGIIFIIGFAWIFWLLGANDILNKWDRFIDSIVFDKQEGDEI